VSAVKLDPRKGWLPDQCPDRDRLHTPCPSDYLGWHEWAARKARTHRQTRCPTCDLFAIWVPKKSRAKATL
jgi:hypothetical protein